MLAMRAAAKLRAQAKFSDMQNQAKVAEGARELERVQREAKEAQQRKELWEADWEKRRTQLLGEEVRRFTQADSQRLLGDDAQTEDTESTLSKATQKWASLVRQLNPDVVEISARGTGSDWSSFTSQSLNAVLRKYHKKVDDLFSSVRTVDKQDDDSSSDDDSFTARPVAPQLQLKHAPTAPSGLQLSSEGTRKPVTARAEDQSKQLVAAERTCKRLIYLALALQDAKSTEEVLARVLAWWPSNLPNKGLLNQLELERILTDIAMRPRPGDAGEGEGEKEEENGWVLPLEAYADVDEAAAEYTGPEREVVSRRKDAAAQELDRLRRRAEEREAEEEDRKQRERERGERQRLEAEQAAAEAKRREEEAERLRREMEEKMRREKEAEEKVRREAEEVAQMQQAVKEEEHKRRAAAAADEESQRRADEEERRRRDDAAAQQAAREEEDRWRQEQSALAQLEAEEVARRAKEERERRQREDEEAALAKKMARVAAAAAARLAAEHERQQREESRRMAEEEKKRLATRRKQEEEEERLRRAKEKASQPRKRVQEFHGRRIDPDKVRKFRLLCPPAHPVTPAASPWRKSVSRCLNLSIMHTYSRGRSRFSRCTLCANGRRASRTGRGRWCSPAAGGCAWAGLRMRRWRDWLRGKARCTGW